MSNVNRIKPWFAEDIFVLILALVQANPTPHPEFIRALVCVAAAVGISREELQKGKLKG